MVGEALQHVADVDDQRSRRRVHAQPLPVAMQHFEPAFLSPQKEGDHIDVLVRARAHRAFRRRFGLRRIVKQAQDRISVLHGVVEEVRPQLEVHRDG